jgi:hypothetical protein
MNKGDKIQIYDCEGHVPEHQNKIGVINAIENGRVHAWIEDGNSAGAMSCWPIKYTIIEPKKIDYLL